jgi:hypothetical protein
VRFENGKIAKLILKMIKDRNAIVRMAKSQISHILGTWVVGRLEEEKSDDVVCRSVTRSTVQVGGWLSGMEYYSILKVQNINNIYIYIFFSLFLSSLFSSFFLFSFFLLFTPLNSRLHWYLPSWQLPHA